VSGDGGPAFPGSHQVQIIDPSGNEPTRTIHKSHYGMSLRDYFAAHAPKQVPDDATSAYLWAERCGVATPDGVSDMLAWSMFWTACESVLRYRHADAMLKAREVTS
jgi:hypothetical protein